MENIFTQGITDKPNVLLYADPEGLAVNLSELLLANYCRVKIVSEKENEWKILSDHLKDNENFEINSQINFSGVSNEYEIFISGVFAKNETYDSRFLKKEEERLLNVRNKDSNAKKLYIFPYQVKGDLFGEINKILNEIFSNIRKDESLMFVGQFVGPRIKLSERDLLSRIIKDAIFAKKIRIPRKDIFIYPINIGDLSRKIIRDLFSFGTYGENIALLGPKYPIRKLSQLVSKSQKVQVEETDEFWEINDFEVDKKIFLDTNLLNVLDYTIKWFEKNKPDFLIEGEFFSPPPKEDIVSGKDYFENKKEKKSKVSLTSLKNKTDRNENSKTQQSGGSFWGTSNYLKEKTKIYKWIFRAIVAFSFFIGIPVITISLSIASLYLAKSKVGDSPDNARKYFVTARNLSSLSNSEFILLTKIPVIGNPFNYGFKYSNLVRQTSGLGVKGIDLLNQIKLLAESILGSTPYDLEKQSKNLSVDLDAFYRETAFLEGEIDELSGFGSNYTKKVFEELDLSNKRDEVLVAKKIVDKLPILLGQEEEKTYLLMFQNNMELRPTGGFIGSFSLIKFSKGRMVDLNIMDVYSADGQLRGHVEPPPPIKEYLNIANWYLRDSNWDPDFQVSAERAEWFIDKEIDQSLDGVIALDLQPIKDTLEFIGPIYIKDFDKHVDKDNIYEVTQYEVEKDFFPGSRKKENFLTALAYVIMNNFIHPKEENYYKLAKVIYKNLGEKHIQIFVHDKDAQMAVSSLGWDGIVVQPKCDIQNCYADWMGLVDANVGVNKANYYLERSADLSVNLEPGYIERELKINLKSNANPVLGYKGVYRTYLRIMLPVDAKVESVLIEHNGNKEEINPEVEYVRGRQDVGFFVEINPQNNKTINLVWTTKSDLKFAEKGEYRFYWRKQAGTDADRISLHLSGPEGVIVSGTPWPLLTDNQNIVYNTNLLKDFVMKANW